MGREERKKYRWEGKNERNIDGKGSMTEMGRKV